VIRLLCVDCQNGTAVRSKRISSPRTSVHNKVDLHRALVYAKPTTLVGDGGAYEKARFVRREFIYIDVASQHVGRPSTNRFVSVSVADHGKSGPVVIDRLRVLMNSEKFIASSDGLVVINTRGALKITHVHSNKKSSIVGIVDTQGEQCYKFTQRINPF
jgi:hypothetical protein